MPIEPATFYSFLIACAAVYVAPGPDMAYVGSNAISHGVRVGLWAGLGPIVGCLVQALAAVLGVSTAIAAFPLVYDAIRWAGIAYLVYLGFQVLRSGPVRIEGSAGATPSPLAAFLRGFLINLFNPKIGLFFIAFLPQFVDPAKGDAHIQLVFLCAVFTSGAILWTCFLAFAFARAGVAMAGSEVAQRWQRRIAGSAFLGFAGLLAVSGAQR